MTDFLTLADSGDNIFLTGQAGTGKSTLLRQWLAGNGRDADVTAPTGIAALNIGGMTIHRWAGIGLGPQPGEDLDAFADHLDENGSRSVREAKQRIRQCRTLVIDEVSMLPGRLLAFLDVWLRRCRGRMAPFGGIQVIATGDFLQLPPVRKDMSQSHDWAFASEFWERAGFHTIRLTKVWRQDEPELLAALNDVRRGRLTPASRATLGRCVKMFPPATMTRLCTHNRDVDKVNRAMLDDLPGPERTYTAEFTPPGDERVREFFAKGSITPLELSLRKDARVMFTVNDAQGRFVNGTTGRVASLTPFSVDVETDDGTLVGVDQFEWHQNPRDRRGATMRQLPLRLAYALTIHKAQGCTLAGAYIDIRAALEPGQAYVALSRVKSLDGLWLKAMPSYIAVCPRALAFQEGKQS
jgi:ATP-dependent DNA helicase PIF1